MQLQLALSVFFGELVDDLLFSRSILRPLEAVIQRSELNMRWNPFRLGPHDLLEVLNSCVRLPLRTFDTRQFI